MAGVSELILSGRKILLVDYSGCKEPDLFQIFDIAKFFLVPAPETHLVLYNLSNTYLTSSFLRYVEGQVGSTVKTRNAFIGLNTPKKMILKGFNLLLGRELKVFDTEQQALDYLLS